jgi:hypothetical protein
VAVAVFVADGDSREERAAAAELTVIPVAIFYYWHRLQKSKLGRARAQIV